MKNKTGQGRVNVAQDLADDPNVAKEIEAIVREGLSSKKTKGRH